MLLSPGEQGSCFAYPEGREINLTKRRDKIRLNLEASRLDDEFVNLVASADAQRDSKNWAQAEWRYWEALQNIHITTDM